MEDKNPSSNELALEIEALHRQVAQLETQVASLQQTEFKYRSLVEKLPIISYIVELDEAADKTVFISPQIETLLGYTPAEWLADPSLWLEQTFPADREVVTREIERAKTEKRNFDLEYRVLARDGRVLWFRNQTTFSADPPLSRYAHGIMIDITRQKRLEEQLLQVQKMEAVGQMAAGIAHNFNNVLTSMLGYAEFALDSLPENHPVKADLEVIKKGTLRAANLTGQLLTFPRHQVTRPHPFNLSELVMNLDPILRQLIDHSVDLVISAPPEVWNVQADSNQLEQVLVNLVVNANEAMPRGGKLTISITNLSLPADAPTLIGKIPPGDYVQVALTDTGVGTPKTVQTPYF
jgi:PAS domain S-box-containing protein